MTRQPDITQLLDAHARALTTGGLSAADAVAQSAADDAGDLMAMAARAYRVLSPVPPDPTFRAGLERGLAVAGEWATPPSHRFGARRQQLTATISRHGTVVMASGAALACLGVALAWWAGRAARPTA